MNIPSPPCMNTSTNRNKDSFNKMTSIRLAPVEEDPLQQEPDIMEPLTYMKDLLDRITEETNLQSRINMITEYLLYCMHKREYLLRTFNKHEYAVFARAIRNRCRVFLADDIVKDEHHLQNVLQQVKTAFSR